MGWRRKKVELPEQITVTVKLPEADMAKLRYQSLRRRLGDYHPETLAAVQDVARLLGAAPEDRDEAVETYLGLIRVLWDEPGPDDPWYLQVVHEAAELVFLTGEVARAEEMFQHTLDGRERILGRDHPDTLVSAQALARVLGVLGRTAEGEALHHDVHDRRRRSGGADDEQTRSSRNDLAAALLADGRFDEAAAEFRALAVDAERAYGPADDRTLTSQTNLAAALFKLGRLDEAAAMFREVLAVPGRSDDDGSVRNNLGTVLFHLGRFAEAEKELRLAVAGHERSSGQRHPETMRARENLARVLAQLGRKAEARGLAQRCLDFYTANYPPAHEKIRGIRELLAELR